jgi:hypothetical protein
VITHACATELQRCSPPTNGVLFCLALSLQCRISAILLVFDAVARTDIRLKEQEAAAREAEKSLDGVGDASAALPIVLLSDTAKKPVVLKLLLAVCALSKAVTQASSHLGIDLSCAITLRNSSQQLLHCALELIMRAPPSRAAGIAISSPFYDHACNKVCIA